MNHQIVKMADGSEWDLVIDHGRFVAIYPQDEAEGDPLLAWHPQQTQPVPREQWRVNELRAERDKPRAISA